MQLHLGYYFGVATLLLVFVNAPASAIDSNLNCTDGSCDEDEAPCPPDSAPEMGPDGGPCVCVQKHCVEPVCRYGSQRVLRKHGSDKPGDCCDIYECVLPKEKNCSEILCPEDVECPADSYRLPSHKAPSDCCSVAQGCQCLPGPCPTATCPEGEHASVVRPGSGKPGACCPLSECLNHDANDTCILDGKLMKNGSEWWKDDCTLCKCNNGLIFCGISPECPDLSEECLTTRIPVGECCPICVADYPSEGIPCMYANGKIHKNGESWQEDPCTTCECQNGVKKCQAYMCEVTCVNPKYVDGECCPLCDGTSLVTLPPHCPGVNNCSLRCMHGFKRDDAGCYVIPCQCEAEQCLLECPRGYQQDPHGNKLCKCAMDMSTAVVPASPNCPPLTACRKNCSHGFRQNKAGCDVCKCSQCKPLNDCGKTCPHGFRANDRGCQICKCQASSETHLNEDRLYATSHATEEALCISTDGQTHDGGEAWFDGCRQCYCHSGVEMCNLIACPLTKCKNPIFNSSTGCCPYCPEDSSNLSSVKEDHRTMLCQSVDGAYRVEGETWTLNGLAQCLCHAGRVLCEGKQCPPASCSQPVYKPGHSCAVCPKTEVARAGLPCSLDRPHGSVWRDDNCRSCACDSGHVTCFNEVCPTPKCDRPILAKNWCCSVCLDNATPKTCAVGNVTYHTDEKWNEDACTHCVCQDGAKFCTEKVCSVACANPIKKPGKCCPICKTEQSLSVGLFNEGTCIGIITVLFCIILVGVSIAVYQRCRRRRQMIVNASSSHSYANNYSTHTPPPQYASADRKDPYQYKYVQSYDATQIDEMLKSPSIGATEKMALAPV